MHHLFLNVAIVLHLYSSIKIKNVFIYKINIYKIQENNKVMHITKNISVLKRKEIKQILAMLKEQWGYCQDLDYVFLKGKDESIYIIEKDISQLELHSIRINSLGLYIGKIKNNMIRLSIEGSQLIGPYASSNIIELNEKLARLWIRGYDIPYDKEKGSETRGFQIIKCRDDYMGCGIFKENRILNFVPKSRRLNVEN